MTIKRVFNFSSGPAVLPLPVLEVAQRDLIALPGIGMSVLEISHRSKYFDDIFNAASEDVRQIGNIPANYKILMLQGGASLQFSMVPMNLLRQGKTADYVDAGTWGTKAIGEARKVGNVNVAASGKDQKYARLPEQHELKLTPGADYVHITSNNTIEGTQMKSFPDVGDVPLVCDASSDIFSRPIDVSRFGVIYAGAQKNLGPSGVTLVIIREDLLERSQPSLPSMLNYKIQAENDSHYNTPNTFGIYVLGLTMKWLRSAGGLKAIAQVNERKAAKLYVELDRSDFYRGTAHKDSRSLMNVTFRLPNEDLEKQFIKEASAAGLDGLAGHRSVGGMRASIYNAFPEDGVDSLISFMREFERRRG